MMPNKYRYIQNLLSRFSGDQSLRNSEAIYPFYNLFINHLAIENSYFIP